MQSIVLDAHLSGLLGFALKARQAATGLDAVKRGVKRKKIAFILCDSTLGKNSFKKVMTIARMSEIPVFIVDATDTENKLLHLSGYKIIGIEQGSFAQGFLKYLRQENK